MRALRLTSRRCRTSRPPGPSRTRTRSTVTPAIARRSQSSRLESSRRARCEAAALGTIPKLLFELWLRIGQHRKNPAWDRRRTMRISAQHTLPTSEGYRACSSCAPSGTPSGKRHNARATTGTRPASWSESNDHDSTYDVSASRVRAPPIAGARDHQRATVAWPSRAGGHRRRRPAAGTSSAWPQIACGTRRIRICRCGRRARRNPRGCR